MKKIVVILLNILSLGLGFSVSGNFSKTIYSYFTMAFAYTLFIISGLGFYSAPKVFVLLFVAVYVYNVIYPLFLETIVFRKVIPMALLNFTMLALLIGYVIFGRMFIYDIFQYQNNFGNKVRSGEVIFSYKSMPIHLPEVILVENAGYTYLTTQKNAKYYRLNLEKSYRGYPVYILWSKEYKRIGKPIQ
ncbi:MAG: hypothetical protein ACK5N8_03210 [Alphaproteobacteria bacterium]